MAEPTAEERELISLLEYNLEGLEYLGLGDSAFDSPPLAKISGVKKILNGVITQAATTEPFKRTLSRITDQRNPVYKVGLLKEYQNAVDQIRDSYDLMCLADLTSVAPIRTVAATLQELYRKDSSAVLAMCLSRASATGDYLSRHSVNVGMLTMAIATGAGFSKIDVLEAGVAGFIADVGMRLVPDEILNKNGKLTEEELGEIHKHTDYSISLLGSMQGCSQIIFQVAQQHHERLSGGGYPERKSGNQICPEARMVGIADTLSALIHKRSHRDALSPQDALDRVVKMAQMNFLDLTLLKGLVGVISIYPLGSAVELNGGRIGRVVEAHPEDPARPIIAVLKDGTGVLPLKSVHRLDLKVARDDKILKCQDPEAYGFKPLDGF